MKLLEVRRLLPHERGGTCEVVTGRGQRCNYTARRVVVLECDDGSRKEVRACRIHVQMFSTATSKQIEEVVLV